ncbi:proline--tRNA ligase [Candidatus Shapirobacteria bacterium]|nr:proline--tRNA ligase [Candidatus Shapirobacteria bacterium]
MRYSKFFGKTSKKPFKKAVATSHQLLLRGGFIEESSAGEYYFLPLGWRVHRKIEEVIRREMDNIGGKEMITPILHPLSLWEETKRTTSVSFELIKVKSRSGAEFALGGTAEEMFVDLVRKKKLSYRDLPLYLYQFSTKFRDELRFRGGLLRVREFIMKDAYSFDENEKKFAKTYQFFWQAYEKIFQALGLPFLVVEADSGYIGGDRCHEFVVPHERGEDLVLKCRQCSYQASAEKAQAYLAPLNSDEEEKPLEVVSQPEWVETMDDNIKHYHQPLWRFLKNVVYKDEKRRIIIASLRGDQEVNEAKLKRVLGAAVLEPATAKDLEKIGTKHGWVHSWGHQGVVYVGDLGLKMVKNFIGGQKEAKTDTINVNYGRDFSYPLLADIASAREGDICPQCREGELEEIKGIEVGHIFELGYHYTHLMKGANFVDKKGKERPFYMGSYGIGLGRTMATIVEVHHDQKGIIWPKSITPYQVHLISLGEGFEKSEAVFSRLLEDGLEVLYDDRQEVSAGEKFADADLIGIPIRLVISPKTGDSIEYKKREEEKLEILQYNEVLERIRKEYYNR